MAGALPRRELTADFHCVAGWSATALRWEGVAFETFYRRLVEPAVQPGASVTHVAFGGLDGYRSVVTIEDALAEDVVQFTLRGPFKPHPRARVWEEERHRHLPNWLVRPVYRLATPPIAFLSAHGSRRSSVDRDTVEDHGSA